AWEAFTAAHAAELNDEAFPDFLRGPWGKLKGYGVRLALIVHFLRWAGGETGLEDHEGKGDVSGETLDRAARPVAYCNAHARQAHAAMESDPQLGDARKLWEWIVRKQREAFKVWEAHQDMRSERFPTPDTLLTPIDVLIRHNLIRRKPAEPRAGPGR